MGEADGASEVVGTVDFLGDVGAAVGFEDFVVEIFDAEAEAGDADVAEDFELAFGECAGFALERYLFHFVPGEEAFHFVDEAAELFGGEVGGRAAAEVDEAGFAAADDGLFGVEGELAADGVEVGFDFAGVLIGIDLEVAEVAAFAAEGDVDVDAEGGAGDGGAVEGGFGFVELFGAPEGEGRVVGDEVVAFPGFLWRRNVSAVADVHDLHCYSVWHVWRLARERRRGRERPSE